MSRTVDRRRFLAASAGLVGAGGVALLSGCPQRPGPPTSGGGTTPTPTGKAAPQGSGKVGANRVVSQPAGPEVEAVLAKSKPRAELVTAALAAYGGMGAFVKKGDRVVIKPNLGWAKGPEAGVDTHPEVVAAIVKACKEAGAAEVIVGEHSCDTWLVVKETCGVPEAAEAAGAHVVGWEDERLYKEVEFPQGQSTKSDRVALDILECDVLINCPKFKHHSATGICGAMKNQMGTILRPQNYHQNTDIFAKDPNLHVNIADLASAVRPTLTIVDLTDCCLTEGPKGGPGSKIKDFRTVVASTDIVACDSLGTQVLGICKVEDVPHIRIAADQHKLGRIMMLDDPKLKVV
jgi:uncharacterized protein (DUF362 family)